jgi:hypothetical protein
MAHQTSATQRKQITPRPIGRVMDVEALWSFLLLIAPIRSGQQSVTREQGIKLATVETALIAQLPSAHDGAI